MIESTKKEIEIIHAVIKASEAGSYQGYIDCIEDGDDNLTLASIDDITCKTQMNENQVGGVLSSLEKKGFVDFCDADTYGLGCNCWYVTNYGLNQLTCEAF